MIPARVLAIDGKTGKIYQAMRSETLAVPVTWEWIESGFAGDVPFTGGDVVFEVPGGLKDFPRWPPRRSNVGTMDDPDRRHMGADPE